jgi:hypothetical protein
MPLFARNRKLRFQTRPARCGPQQKERKLFLEIAEVDSYISRIMVAFVYLNGFDLAEAGSTHTQKLWQRGGFPRSFLAASDAASHAWREDFIETFLSRDAARFGIALPPEQLRRFWTMLAHLHGGVLNAAELGRAISSIKSLPVATWTSSPGLFWCAVCLPGSRTSANGWSIGFVRSTEAATAMS